MKIYDVDFEGMWPVGNCLIIAATSLDEAIEITKSTIKHTNEFTIHEIDVSSPRVIKYLSGDY